MTLSEGKGYSLSIFFRDLTDVPTCVNVIDDEWKGR
jgi:hypothetical protein